MFIPSPNVPDAILLHGIVRATMYVPNPGGESGRLLAVHTAKTVEDVLGYLRDSAERIAVVVVDVQSLGRSAGLQALKELGGDAAMEGIPAVAWVAEERHAELFSGGGTFVVRRPSAPEDRYVQIGRMIAAYRAGGADELRAALAGSILLPKDRL